MNSEEKDLMGVGAYCAVADCHQLDFLPFKCECCNKVYCLEHRTYAAHRCEKAQGKETQVFVCPLCARAVKMQAGDDANTAFDRHCQTECDPSNYARVHKKPRCPVPGCKEKLTSVNTYTCRDCGTTVCLRHRLSTDHKCQGKVAAPAAAAGQTRFAIPQAFKGLFSGGSSQGNTGRNSAPQPSRSAAAAAAAKPSAGASNGNVTRGVGLPAGASGSVGAAAPRDMVDLTSPTRPAAGNGGPEVCQQCGARFATVQQLIAHAEQAHMGGGGPVNFAAPSQQWLSQPRQQRSGGGHGELERCPHCGQQFADAVELVSHVERVHASSQKDGCVLC